MNTRPGDSYRNRPYEILPFIFYPLTFSLYPLHFNLVRRHA
jgi:hypothetical protein